VLPQLTVVRDNVPTADVVFHLAWSGVTADVRNDPRRMDENVALGLRFLSAAQRCWVGLGSQAEYGPVAGVLREDLPLRPVTPYGEAKVRLAVEAQQRCAAAGIRFVWLRLVAAYGPKDDERHLIPSVILKLLARAKPALTSGQQKWDYLYVDDVAEAICRAGCESSVSGAFNLASGEPHRVREIVETIRDMIDQRLPLGFGELPDQPMELTADVARLKQAVGWSPRVTLREGLQRTVAWYSARVTPR
jgi:nucleoside-diphosphate-sugar epimerase